MSYVTYEPFPGLLNNTRRCFETVVAVSALLKRTLVVPDCFAPGRGNVWEDRRAWPHPSKIYDLDVLQRSIDVVTTARDEAWRTDSRLVFAEEPCTAVVCYPEIPAEGTPDHDRLRQFAVNRTIYRTLPAKHQQWQTIHFRQPFELFYAFLFLPADQDLRLKRLIRDALVFRPEFITLANRAIAQLGTYDAVHVRRTDFVYQHGPWLDLAPEQIAAALVPLIERGRVLYVATDEPDAAYLAPLRARYQVVVAADILDDRDAPTEAVACAEQLICARAGTFVGTRFSTFSSYITRVRGYDRVADPGIYFTDGQPELGSNGAPYSWTAWLQAGLPLWGREFAEAWQIPS